jgi:hypothetical protein
MSDLVQGRFPQPTASDGLLALVRWERRVARNWEQKQYVSRKVLENRYGKSAAEMAAIAARYKECRP